MPGTPAQTRANRHRRHSPLWAVHYVPRGGYGRRVSNQERAQPVRIALVDDYEVVVAGIAHMLAPYPDRIAVVQLTVGQPVETEVDVVLLDTFAQGEADQAALGVLLANPHARRVAVYTWSFQTSLIDVALDRGVHGYLSKALQAPALVDSLERIHRGESVISAAPPKAHINVGRDWPGRTDGLTDREAEVIALITQGHSNAEIAAMTYLSINSIKSYIRGAYVKLGVKSRTQAVLWGIDHGFGVDHRGIDTWRPPR